MKRMSPKLSAYLALALCTTGSAFSATAVSGEAVYQKRCAACHDMITPRVPPREALQKLTASRILRTLDFGVMMNVAYYLRRDEREAVAAYLGVPGADQPPSPKAFCAKAVMPTVTEPSASARSHS